MPDVTFEFATLADADRFAKALVEHDIRNVVSEYGTAPTIVTLRDVGDEAAQIRALANECGKEVERP
jgi:hypothetical protein